MATDHQDWLAEVQNAAAEADGVEALEALRVLWLGRKGRVTEALRGLGQVPAEERKSRGQALNAIKGAIEAVLDEAAAAAQRRAQANRFRREAFDMSLPGLSPNVGWHHPLTMVRRQVVDTLLSLGFSVAGGPTIEDEWHNFEALNMPSGHPARDMQDSFFIDVPGLLLRTHTSPVQIRAMHQAKGRLPLKVIAPGHVFRRDDDATHSPMFTQVEGLLVDHGISLADLKGTLLELLRGLFGADSKIRLRPSYFPFTEPSVEVDVSCAACHGTGCRTCKQTGWLEILGAGMVHPLVLQNGGYDPKDVSGFAFGLGLERVAMLLYGFDDLRPLYQNDLRFLAPFAAGDREVGS